MSTINSSRETAKIIPFPVSSRRSASLVRTDAVSAAASLTRAPDIVFGNAWYHEAAIRQAEPLGRR